ncbi:macro domain-containing protein [Cronobacter malonaticus]|uniref:macro domain-containing protein n=2 Tax=Cronobacter malonaticus TaxID=413503 RepID=UPI002894CA17|nr:macro domain-containing protein [Cronobacter malonaticus]MDT3579408.1 macro domain-containing protein [Cronobacter malonaticus]
MIKFVDGDFFDYAADIRINTVNCVGVMGAGVAFAFKNKFPEMYNEYVLLCKKGKISPGKPAVWKSFDSYGKEIEIINFPTKDHWKNKSKYEYIEQGLVWLSNYLSTKHSKVITLPALGCGHGGLDWEIVKKMIQDSLSNNNNEILVFSPQASKNNKRAKVSSNHSYPLLKDLNISELRCEDKRFPVKLSTFSNRSLYYTGQLFTDFDLSIISSTSPSDLEKKVVLDIIEISAKKGYSLLFGGTAFDKMMAFTALRKGIKTGVFLPSGIAKSAEKLNLHGEFSHLTIFSFGDPFVQFNRSEYLPSVFSRMFLPRRVLLTTSKLQWLKKHKKIILQNNVDSFFLISEASDNDIYAANLISSKAIDEHCLLDFI